MNQPQLAVQLNGQKSLTPIFPESKFTKQGKKYINFKDEQNQRKVAMLIHSNCGKPPYWKEVDY